MRRIERLKNNAKIMAERLGHNLVWDFSETPEAKANVYYSTEFWITGKCINCDMLVYISESLKPLGGSGCNVKNAPMEIHAMKLAWKENNIAKQEEKKIPFPKRSKGVVYGPAVIDKCNPKKV